MTLTLITLRVVDRSAAPEHADAHRRWLAEGFASGMFLAAGSLDAEAGGAILARGDDPAALARRVAADPFVAHGVVEVATVTFTAARVAEGLESLLGAGA